MILSFTNSSLIQFVSCWIFYLGSTSEAAYWLLSALHCFACLRDCVLHCDVTDAFVTVLWCDVARTMQPFHWFRNSKYSWISMSGFSVLTFQRKPPKSMFCTGACMINHNDTMGLHSLGSCLIMVCVISCVRIKYNLNIRLSLLCRMY